MIGGRIHLEISLKAICIHSPELTQFRNVANSLSHCAFPGQEPASVHQPGALDEAHLSDAALWSLAPISPKAGLKSVSII